MDCPSCGVENRAERKFCSSCGSPLRPTCASCGTPNEPGDAFCGECGAALGPSAASPGSRTLTAPGSAGATSFAGASGPHGATTGGSGPGARPGVGTSAAPPVSELRLVSVLFVDLVGFTTLAEDRDAEDVRELLSSYFDVARAIVGRYGGIVEKFIGDAVMAVWGAPVTNEDDAERAVRAALDLVEAVGELGRENGLPALRARAGVLTGEAAATLGAEGQGMVAGDLVNTASRFQSAAEPGSILVGEATFLATRDAIAFSEVGALELKGKAEPLPAWRALRVVAQRKGVGRSDRLEPPFVGRQADLRIIVDHLHATSRERKARLVSVTGVPGIGKSRLAWEFLKYVDGLADTVYWHHGRSPAYGEGVSFWALGEMVRERARIAEGEDVRSSRAKLAAALEEFVADAEERRWMEPRLLHLLGQAEAPPGDRQELFAAWRTFFERVAEHGTTVMIFEDLQWADSGLLDYIESTIEWSRQHPILIVTLSRPELAEHRATWGAGARSFMSLHLEPLPDDAMRELLGGLVHGLPEDAEHQLVRRAEGVPLYAVETVRALLDRGLLVQRDDAYELVGELRDISIPETLHALIAARLDALSSEERSLVQDASVLGTTFTLPLLAAVAGAAPDALAGRLRDLLRKEVFFLDSNPRSPERGQYGFVQSVIGEVAYGTLSKRDRRARHLAAAHQLESLGDDEVAGVVASHYLDGYRLSAPGPESKAVAARARDWLGQASARANSLGSSEEAVAYAEQAVEIATPGPERAAILERAGEAARLVSNYELATAHYEEAVGIYRGLGDEVAAGRATVELAECLGWQGHLAEGVARAEQALAAIDGPDGEQVRVRLACTISGGHRGLGTSERALEWAEVALPLAERIDDPDLLRHAFMARAGPLFDLGRRRECAALSQAIREMASGSLREQAEALLRESVALHDDDPRAARRIAADAAALYRRAGDRGMETMNALNAVEFALYLGEWDFARRTLDDLAARPNASDFRSEWRACCQALLEGMTGRFAAADALFSEVEGRMGSGEHVAMRHTMLHMRAMAGLASGELARSRRDAAAIVEENPSGMNSAVPLSILARAALWSKDPSGAEEAVAGMAAFHGRWMAAVRATSQAGVLALRARQDEAAAAYQDAAQRWRVLDVPLDLALCGLDAALLLDEDHQQAELVEESRAIFGDLGAAPFLTLLGREVRTPTGAPSR